MVTNFTNINSIIVNCDNNFPNRYYIFEQANRVNFISKN